jgi:hypothetical protein
MIIKNSKINRMLIIFINMIELILNKMKNYLKIKEMINLMTKMKIKKN